ncbi:TIR domain-containing protein [Zoogloea sp.]|uniref:nSTAND1 domain-containing NTPase n=1 Tax=Zoogloea sp. TaxID=49181 RepID=UPI00260F9BC4|nr:TIR domain-containing protein [Zoogloea sp.]MDD3354628.1 TIR domain-containing protein [Zoogloea sp.]
MLHFSLERALRKAGERCAAVIVLVSPQWVASKWCLTEFLFAAQLGKEIFPVLISPCPLEELPLELTATYQFADISTPEKQADGYERLRIGLHRAGLHPGAFPWPPKDEPKRPLYRGLKVLEEQDAAIFFGRDTQITKALDTIRRLRDGAPERALVILGASGAGKSSFLRAGLLARLKRDCERFLILPTVRPGRAALTGASGLYHSLGVSAPLYAPNIPDCVAALRAPALEHLRVHASHPESGPETLAPTIVLPIDQAEELFVAGDQEASAAIEIIAELVKADSNLLLLLTIRSDSFELLQEDTRLVGIPRLPFDLPRLPPAALKEIIEGPARLPSAGISIEAELTEQLISDFDGPDTLPLLAFTLERLLIEHGTDGRLTQSKYMEEMKGVGGAIRQAVENAFARAAEMPGLPQERAALDELARRCFVPGLVRIDHVAGVPKRRVALRRKLPSEALSLIDCLADQRLLVSDMDGAEATVEVSHEAVLRYWRELASWIAERRDELRMSERVTAAAAEWRAAEGQAKTETLIHRGERLQAAEQLAQWEDLDWKDGGAQIEYLKACRELENNAEKRELERLRRQQLQRQWIGALVVVVALVTVLGAILVVAGQRNLGLAQSLMLARTAERLAEEGDYVRALRLSILAAHSNSLIPASAEAFAALSSNALALSLTVEIRGHTGPVVGAIFSADQRRILTWSEDGTARQWDVTTGEQIGPELKHDDGVLKAIFSADQRHILTWSGDGTARKWDTATGEQIGTVLEHEDWITEVVFMADGRRILTWGTDKVVQWDAMTGMQIGPALKYDGRDLSIGGVAVSADGRRILAWDTGWYGEGVLQQWDATKGEKIKIGQALQDYGMTDGAVFSPDQRRILTWSRGSRTGYGTKAAQWDVATGEQIGPGLAHNAPVLGAMFSADQLFILTWSEDGTARLWDVLESEPIGLVLKHDGAVYGAVFSANQRRILTWSEDGTAREWDAVTGRQIGPPLQHDGAVVGAAYSADQRRILTWSKDGTARLWDTSPYGPRGAAHNNDGRIGGAKFSADGRRILTWTDDGSARLWDTTTGGQIGSAFKHDARIARTEFSEDGRRILTWTDDGSARLWDTTTSGQIGSEFKHGARIARTEFSKDGRRILTWTDDGSARLWDATTGGQIGPAFKNEDEIAGALFSPDGRRFLTWRKDGTARLWDAATGEQIGSALKHDDRIARAEFSENGRHILTWTDDRKLWQWDTATGRTVGPALKDIDKDDWVVITADGRRILTRVGNNVLQWDATTGTQVGPALAQDDDVFGDAVFSKDERLILTWSASTAQLWDAATGMKFGPALTHRGRIEGAVFSADARLILTWGLDSTARLWDVATGVQIGPALGHGESVLDKPTLAVFSADQRHVFTASTGGRVRKWDVKWATRNPREFFFIEELCREKLVGETIQTPSTSSGGALRVGVRHVDTRDTSAAPILRGREGEDVCAPPPTTWGALLSLLRAAIR